MPIRLLGRGCVWIAAALLLGGCQSIGESFASPEVELAGVRLVEADLTTQRFVLDFDVRNPNPVALPVRAVNYGVDLGGMRLASGSSEQPFRIPAGGAGAFSVTVETSLLESARLLGARLLRGGEQSLDYDIGGSVEIDLPFVRPLPFSSRGTVSIARP